MRLIDRLLPHPDFALRHSVVIDAPVRAVREAIVSAKAGDDPLVSLLFALRRIPAHGFRGVLKRNDGMNIESFALLIVGQDALAYGLVGRFWRASPDIVPIQDLASFERFDATGFAKLVLSFEMHAVAANRTTLSTFTHVRCDDTRAWLAMSLYWAVIRPGIGLVRRRHLRRIKISAEAGKRSARPGHDAK